MWDGVGVHQPHAAVRMPPAGEGRKASVPGLLLSYSPSETGFNLLALKVCPAGERCLNQAFTKRQYSQVEIFRTLSRGWGLRCVHDIKKVNAGRWGDSEP